MVERYIKQLLYSHDCVIIPGLGGFIVNYKSARVQFSKNSILPPAKEIAFNEELCIDDALLRQAVAQGEHVSMQEADRLIEVFVSNIKKNINKYGYASLKNIGKLYLNDNKKTDFDQSDKLNFRTDSFGLPELFFKPLVTESKYQSIFKPKEKSVMAEYDEKPEYDDEYEYEDEFEDEEEERQGGIPNSVIYSLIGLVLLVTIFTTYIIFMGHKDNAFNRAMANVFPFMGPDKTKEVKEEADKSNKLLPGEESKDTASSAGNKAKDTADSFEKNTSISEDEFSGTKEDKASAEAEKNKKAAGAKEINSRTGRWYIMAGAFAVKSNAYELNDKLRKKGLNSKIIKPYNGNGLHKVTLEDHGELEKCLNRASQLRPDHGKEIWCMHY